MAVSSATITTTTATAFIPTIWSVEVVGASEFGATLQKRVNRRWESDMSVGNTYNVPRLSNLQTQTKSSGLAQTINYEAITEGTQAVTVSTQEYAAFAIENIVQVQANQDLRQRYTEKLGYALARGRDVTLANLVQNITTNIVGAYGNEIVSDDLVLSWRYLAEAGLLEQSPDPGEVFSTFLSPAAYAGCLKVDIFQNRQYNTQGDVIAKARVGDLYGSPVYISNLLRSPASGQHDCVQFHRDAFALIVQKEIPVVSQFIIANFADGVAAWNVYGAARITFPPETPGGGTAIDNRAVFIKSV